MRDLKSSIERARTELERCEAAVATARQTAMAAVERAKWELAVLEAIPDTVVNVLAPGGGRANLKPYDSAYGLDARRLVITCRDLDTVRAVAKVFPWNDIPLVAQLPDTLSHEDIGGRQVPEEHARCAVGHSRSRWDYTTRFRVQTKSQVGEGVRLVVSYPASCALGSFLVEIYLPIETLPTEFWAADTRRVSQSEYIYFPGESAAEIGRMRIGMAKLKGGRTVQYVGGDIVSFSEVLDARIVEAVGIISKEQADAIEAEVEARPPCQQSK